MSSLRDRSLLVAGGAAVGALVYALARRRKAVAARAPFEFSGAAGADAASASGADSEDATVRVVCYGDSNTWGFDAFSENADASVTRRYGEARRWPRIAASALGEGYAVVEEGLNGRTTIVDDPFMVDYDANGRRALPAILHSHKPLDVVVIMLGTNDLKTHLALTPSQIAKGAGALVGDVRRAGLGRTPAGPRVLLVAPAVVYDNAPWAFEGARAKSKKCAPLFAAEAAARGAAFLDAGAVCAIPDPATGGGDGIHLSPANCEALGAAVADAIAAL